jgi:hypothetical protein
MATIRNKDITVTDHTVDGFTLSYIADSGDYYHKRYRGYGIRDAKARCKEYIVYGDDSLRDDVLVEALRCICGGSRETARELLGNS